MVTPEAVVPKVQALAGSDVFGPAGSRCGWRRPGRTGLEGRRGARCKLTPAQVRELEAVLDAGPAAWGWEGQCWTLAPPDGACYRVFTNRAMASAEFAYADR